MSLMKFGQWFYIWQWLKFFLFFYIIIPPIVTHRLAVAAPVVLAAVVDRMEMEVRRWSVLVAVVPAHQVVEVVRGGIPRGGHVPRPVLVRLVEKRWAD